MTPRLAALALGVAYTALVLLITLGPVPQRIAGSQADRGILAWRDWFDSATWTSGSSFEFAANVMLFVPWGALVVLIVGPRRWWLAVLAGVVLTTAIEIAQIPTARISDPRDLVANIAGTVIGVVVAIVVAALVSRARPLEPVSVT
ncbi:VanZ family protein [Microcella sp.]|uniref:VanZ family protein n=1 Tax=Microcella sp. TaxID=1913979 RepID=UPI003F719867